MVGKCKENGFIIWTEHYVLSAHFQKWCSINVYNDVYNQWNYYVLKKAGKDIVHNEHYNTRMGIDARFKAKICQLDTKESRNLSSTLLA